MLADFITEFAHIGHIVTDLEAAITNFKRVYGISDDDIRIIPNPEGMDIRTKFAFITVGEMEFELIEPVSDQSKDMLLNMPSGLGGINHVAYCVNDIQGAIARLSQQGIRPGHVTPNGPLNTGANTICYLDPATTGGLLIELVEG